ncbi:CDGSH iron-sulfur domain-containing protein [Flavobacteriaceae bacterium]|jgi:CDGSH-type Zn-finger protein|nr:CDGSH iron-sulfur domain-containing protein [Flavobacteriaceae bacterium]
MENSNKPTIQISATGKVVVTNAKQVTLLDAEGNEIPTRNRFSLCNCGKTLDAPFCDGAHKN